MLKPRERQEWIKRGAHAGRGDTTRLARVCEREKVDKYTQTIAVRDYIYIYI